MSVNPLDGLFDVTPEISDEHRLELLDEVEQSETGAEQAPTNKTQQPQTQETESSTEEEIPTAENDLPTNDKGILVQRDRIAAEEQIANMEANPSAPQMGGPGSAAHLKGQRSRGEGHWAPEPEPGGIKRAGSERKSYTKQSDRY